MKILLLWFILIMVGLATLTSCVPIRQWVPVGDGVSGSSANIQYESPNDFKNLGPDAWKSEMEGLASWYGLGFDGRLTSNGEIYNMYAMTAAHKTLPLGTVVQVHDLDNGKSVVVRINDRGPYVLGRIIDLSKAAAEAIDMTQTGTAHVKLEIVQWPSDSPK